MLHKLAALLINKQFSKEKASLCPHLQTPTQTHKICIVFSIASRPSSKEKWGQLESNETAISYDKLSLDTKNSI